LQHLWGQRLLQGQKKMVNDMGFNCDITWNGHTGTCFFLRS